MITFEVIKDEYETNNDENVINLSELQFCLEKMPKFCVYNNCNTIPDFNFENENSGLYCKNHKLENMIDVKHKTYILKIVTLYQFLILKMKEQFIHFNNNE